MCLGYEGEALVYRDDDLVLALEIVMHEHTIHKRTWMHNT